MPVGNVANPETIYEIDGVRIGVTAAGVRYKNRNDLVVIELAEKTSCAVVTTQSSFCAAPVQVLRKHIANYQPRYLLINTGNANAGTGREGIKRTQLTCESLAERLDESISAQNILPFSTGVIGEPLNTDALIAGLDAALANLNVANWQVGANAIRTTDTIAKLASEQVAVDGTTYHITGMSKGAGMIRPNMATMLGFIATDANITQPLLQQMLSSLTQQSFNRITVDGDTSTNDCCVLLATAKANTGVIDSDRHPHYQALYEALARVFLRLAQLIVRDGEGATKFISVNVCGGATQQECCDVAYAIAHSPLVKTACFASDPNWGRLLAAIGYAGVEGLDQNNVSVSLNEVNICERGQIAEDYTEERGQAAMSRPEIVIKVDLARGDYEDTVYTCDLSYDYIKINADYRS
ncbi:bifunctional glutamate N-acetyltransferase/amino-acid acetyltransferase ArgJ [Psychrobacter sp. I-STPA10]|uniref:bifunctional glutamate N-acetyltransferase/amino-acid acetyltransferase ArgJ n=1 Tax=Psychrobacter sp. I-STPA10 TaxID=2585769 RepID=UPI001E52DA47|nr:bifunctional glutamate N-acetyltransferase/amino-acid acetyltransferase ArgJ [Psychrobacter sp. I-STPA10]